MQKHIDIESVLMIRKKIKSPQQYSFVNTILLRFLKFTCNHKKNGWCKKNVNLKKNKLSC